MADRPDFAAMSGDDVFEYLREALALNPAARSATVSIDRATGEYLLTFT